MNKIRKLNIFYLSLTGTCILFVLIVIGVGEVIAGRTYSNFKFGNINDIDNNEYQTVKIGRQVWMAENLRTSRYNDGSDIITGLSDHEWAETDKGAYVIYPHSGGITEDYIRGINSEKEMAEAYGYLYNWYAVDDGRGLCPPGWRVPSKDDWYDLIYYLMQGHGLHNCFETDNVYGVGSALKSCRQVNSPLAGNCATSLHPRWNFNDINYGTNDFGFNATPGGSRTYDGIFNSVGYYGLWWSASGRGRDGAWYNNMGYDYSNVSSSIYSRNEGLSVRCVTDFVRSKNRPEK